MKHNQLTQIETVAFDEDRSYEPLYLARATPYKVVSSKVEERPDGFDWMHLELINGKDKLVKIGCNVDSSTVHYFGVDGSSIHLESRLSQQIKIALTEKTRTNEILYELSGLLDDLESIEKLSANAILLVKELSKGDSDSLKLNQGKILSLLSEMYELEHEFRHVKMDMKDIMAAISNTYTTYTN